MHTRTILVAILCTGGFLAELDAQATRYRDLVFPSASITQNIAYGSAVNRHSNRREILQLDLYQPSGDQVLRRPAIVLVHGGGLTGGSKSNPNLSYIGTDLARRGFVAVSINYRVAPSRSVRTSADITAASHDMKAAIRWLRRYATTYRIDGSRIGCLGHSAGAFLCCETAYVPGEGVSGNPGYSSEVGAVVDLWGALTDLTKMDKGEAPVMIIHGTKDPAVPYSNATALKSRADAVGVPAELFPINAGHGPWSIYFNSYYGQHSVPFFYRWLRLSELSGVRARPGFSSPGNLTVDVFGDAGRTVILAAGFGARANVSFPPFGTLCLSPSAILVFPPGALPNSPRIARRSYAFAVPNGVRGDIHWQALVANVAGDRLTNCVTTTFR